MKPTSQSRIFISYCHRGNGLKWKAALLHALQVFEQHQLLDVWHDSRIPTSSNLDGDIKHAMSNAQLAVVLLTKEALESKYILSTEFPVLFERQHHDKLPVFPVICEPCNWTDHDWLRATQAPNEAKPFSEVSEAAQDRVFRKLATDIAKELSRVALAELSPPSPPGGETAGISGDFDAKTYLDKFPLVRSSGQREEKLILTRPEVDSP